MAKLTKNLAPLCEALIQGQLVAIPTETVYGIAANAYNDQAITRIYELKNRPVFNPLIVHYPSLERMEHDIAITDTLKALSEHFWPGPLTIIAVKLKNSRLSSLATAGLDTVAVRIPNHPLTLDVLEHIPFPLAAPSANPSSQLSSTTSEHVQQYFHHNPKLPYILDGGPCLLGIESTILDITGGTPQILRPGFVTRQDLVRFCPHIQESPIYAIDKPNAPGQLLRHYAPCTPLRLNCLEPAFHEAYLGFGPISPSIQCQKILNLSPKGLLNEAAAHLFAMLHQLDQGHYAGISIAPIPNDGLGIAINDRLIRAATKE